MPIEVIRPILPMLPSAEPFFRDGSQCIQHICLDLPVPGEYLLRRAVAPMEVDVTVFILLR